MRRAMAAASMVLAWSMPFAGSAMDVASPAGLLPEIETVPAKGMLPLESRTLLGLTLGKHTLSDVKSRLGEANLVKMERVEGRPNSLCYRSNNAGDDTVVLFEAGPLGGFEKLTAATVAPLAAFGNALRDCVLSGKVNRSSATAGKLRLGGDIKVVAKSLRASLGTTKAGLVELPFEKTVKVKERATGKLVEVDTSSGVVARTSNSTVNWFSIYYIESL